MPKGEDWLDITVITVIFFIFASVAGITAGVLADAGRPPLVFYLVALAESFVMAAVTFKLKA